MALYLVSTIPGETGFVKGAGSTNPQAGIPVPLVRKDKPISSRPPLYTFSILLSVSEGQRRRRPGLEIYPEIRGWGSAGFFLFHNRQHPRIETTSPPAYFSPLYRVSIGSRVEISPSVLSRSYYHFIFIQKVYCKSCLFRGQPPSFLEIRRREGNGQAVRQHMDTVGRPCSHSSLPTATGTRSTR